MTRVVVSKTSVIFACYFFLFGSILTPMVGQFSMPIDTYYGALLAASAKKRNDLANEWLNGSQPATYFCSIVDTFNTTRRLPRNRRFAAKRDVVY
jgi:hypothetical protein